MGGILSLRVLYYGSWKWNEGGELRTKEEMRGEFEILEGQRGCN